MTAKILANYPAAVRSLIRVLRSGNRASDPWVDKYTNDGGSTGAAWLGSLEQVGEKMTEMYQQEMNLRQADMAMKQAAEQGPDPSVLIKYPRYSADVGGLSWSSES